MLVDINTEVSLATESVQDIVLALQAEPDPVVTLCVTDVPILAAVKQSQPLVTHGKASPNGVTVQEAVWYFMDMKRRQRWTDDHFDTFLKVLKMLLGGNTCNLPGSLWQMRRALGAESVWDYAIHVCPKFHRNFAWQNGEGKPGKRVQEVCGVPTKRGADGEPTEWCTDERYDVVKTARGEEYRPKEYYFYFTVKRLVRRWMMHYDFAKQRASPTARAPENACVMSSPHGLRVNEHPMVGGRLLRETPSENQEKPGVLRTGMGIEYGEDDGQAKKHDKQCDPCRCSYSL